MAGEAEGWYKQDGGDNGHADKEGMSLSQLTARLTRAGLGTAGLALVVCSTLPDCTDHEIRAGITGTAGEL